MATVRKLLRSKSGLRIVPTDENNSSPFELSEPQWDLDQDFLHCIECQSKFDFVKRRHHCRRCGHIFCSRCTNSKLALPRMCFLDPVRLCDSCARVTRKENEFYDKHLKTLINGAKVVVSQDETGELCLFCKLSNNHRQIMFDGRGIDPLSLIAIHELHPLKSIEQIEGIHALDGLEITFDDIDKQQRKLRFTPTESPNKQHSIAWLRALQKLVLPCRLVYECAPLLIQEKMEHQLHFNIEFALTRHPQHQAAFFKVDGQRFKNTRTVKLHSDSAYTLNISFRPPQTIESLTIHGSTIDVVEKSRDHLSSVYLAVWSTKGIPPTHKGDREQIPMVMKITQKGTLRACLQAKMYRAEDEQHCAWGSSFRAIEWECNANEHRNHVDIAKETFR